MSTTEDAGHAPPTPGRQVTVPEVGGRRILVLAIGHVLLLVFFAILLMPPAVYSPSPVPPVKQAQVDARQIGEAAVMFRLVHGHWPTMAELHQPDVYGVVAVEALDKDPWGRPYGLFVSEDGASVTVRSAGADGLPFNDDDIVVTQPGTIRKR
jgi:hypothetical protein